MSDNRYVHPFTLTTNMGQYYRFIFLSESGEIVHWINCSKMMEFAWQSDDGDLVEAVETILAGSNDKRYHVVCAGDYGAPEPKPTNSRWVQKNDDIETLLAAIKGVAEHYLDDIDYNEAKAFLRKSPLAYTEADQHFAQQCLSAWHSYIAKKNLYYMCDDLPERKIKPTPSPRVWYPYIVNHSRKEYVDKRKNSDRDRFSGMIHPLPLLVCETAADGHGDYFGTREIDVGMWARDIITMESYPPADYKEYVVGFRECRWIS
jgi:hypothetical protein